MEHPSLRKTASSGVSSSPPAPELSDSELVQPLAPAAHGRPAAAPAEEPMDQDQDQEPAPPAVQPAPARLQAPGPVGRREEEELPQQSFLLVEAICSQLCIIHPCATQSAGTKRSRWALVLADYVAIREAVLDSRRLMTETNLQLFQLNMRTLSQWYSKRQQRREVAVLEQDVVPAPAPNTAAQPLLQAKPLHLQQEGSAPRFVFLMPEDQSRQATQRGRPAPRTLLPATQPHQPHTSQQLHTVPGLQLLQRLVCVEDPQSYIVCSLTTGRDAHGKQV
ncbi:uncharacterized protein LOC144539410 [Centroberyx gerrardi]